ncbi:hypothetical protein GCM10010124_33270 [Pilimelia terevasa]|uniref:Lipoprotein n=1 Tax=Pilimelia terevasa TaxID=53372 RepID=A0A8J3FK95_9ACTN|nr:hypothetical protein [Pilimelia terevasa]GGK37808.1 hypothetical protein GCM10010124_33270 [Pilimelia terevasa]
MLIRIALAGAALAAAGTLSACAGDPAPPAAGPTAAPTAGGAGGGQPWLCTWEKLWLSEAADQGARDAALKKVEEFKTKPGYQELDGVGRQSLDEDIAKARAGDASAFEAYVRDRC